MRNNQRGFSLLEGMIGAGVLGVLALGSATLMTNLNRSNSRAASHAAATNLINTLSIAKNVGSCSQTLTYAGTHPDFPRAQNRINYKVTQANIDVRCLPEANEER